MNEKVKCIVGPDSLCTNSIDSISTFASQVGHIAGCMRSSPFITYYKPHTWARARRGLLMLVLTTDSI